MKKNDEEQSHIEESTDYIPEIASLSSNDSNLTNGTTMDQEAMIAEQKQTPLPKGGMLAVIIGFVCEGFSYTFVFPFMGFMILDFGLVQDERDTGYYAGLLAGCFAVAQFFSGFVFGVLSDKYSKKSVVLISTVGCIVTIIMFGFSPSYGFALFSRVLSGTLNGNIGTIKAYLSDITDKTNQSLAFSFIGLAWGLGATLGPLVGGFLSNPATKYPSIFGGITLFKKFPYLLPCLFSGLVMVSGFVASLLYMNPIPQPNSNTNNSNTELQDIEEGNTTPEEPQIISEDATFDESLQTTQEQSDQAVLLQTDQSKISQAISAIKKEALGVVTLVWNLEVALTISLYFLVSTIDTVQEELFPLWAMIDKTKGGLSFNTIQIGSVQMIIGILLLVQPVIFPICAKMLGKLQCLRIGFLLIVPLLFTPQINLISGSSAFTWIGLTIFSAHRALTSMLTFVSVFILINNAAPHGTSGKVMGISNSAGCVARAVAPFIAGPMLALSTKLASKYSVIFLNAPFLFFAVLSLVGLGLSIPLTKHLEEPKTERSE